MKPAYTYLPTQMLEEQERAQRAAAWAQAQTSDLATHWAQMHVDDARDTLGPLMQEAQTTQEPAGVGGGLDVAPSGSPSLEGVYSPPEAPIGGAAAGGESLVGAPAPAEPAPDPVQAALDLLGQGAAPMAAGEGDRPASEFEPPSQLPPPEDGGAVGRRWDDGGAVGGGWEPPAAPGVLGTAGGFLAGQINQTARRTESLREHSNLMAEKIGRGEPLTPEDRARGGELVEPFATALTGEPIAGVGGTIAGAAGRSALGAAAIKKTEEMYADAASHAGTPLGQRMSALGTHLTRAVTDAGVDLTNLEKDAQRVLGRPLRANEMASVQSRLNPFYTARIAVDEGIRPAITDLSDADYNAVRNALTWKGNVDVAAAKGVPNRAFSGGLSAAESEAALAEQARRLGSGAAEVDGRVQQVVDFNRAELERDVAAGLVSRAQADQWLQQYPNYTPVVISDYLKEQGRAIGGRSLSVQGTGYKTLSAAGTSRARLDPIAASIDAAYQGEALRRQNTAWKALHDLIQSTPEMADLFQVQKGGYSGATKHETSVQGYIDGELHTITTPFPDIAKAIRQEAGGVNVPGWNTAMALYKELITGRNPTFLVGNAAVDAPLAILNTAMREGGAHHLIPIAVDLFKGYADAFKGVMSGQYTGKATRDYLAGGGGMGLYGAPSATSGAKEVGRLRRGTVLEVNSPADVARLAKDLVSLEWVKGLGERVELGPRAMAYQRGLKRGLEPEQAVLEGRTVTVDFAQGGTVAKILNSFVPFLNPAVQGVATTGRIIKEHPRGALMTLGPALVGPALAAQAWNRADPERSKAYDDVPDYVKDRGIVVMLPGAPPVDEKGEPHPQFVTINLRQLAPIAAMTRAVYDRAAGRNGRTAADLLQGAAQQISPVQDVSGLLPPFATTAAELAANRDLYRRADIATARGDERASALSQAVAPAIGARPSQVEFGLRETTGAVGEMATGASNIVTGRTRASNAPQDIPVVGGFARRIVRGDTGQTLQTARDERLSPALQTALRDVGLAADVSVVPAELRKIPLLKAEQAVYQQATNKYLNELLGPILAEPDFATMPTESKKKLVTRMLDSARKMAAGEVLDMIPPEAVNERLNRVIEKKAS